jgi:hypothetical protein
MSNYKAGEFLLESCTIINSEKDTIDFSADVVSGFRLYESIFKKFVTGDIHLLDGLNILKNYKFTGQESLTIRMKQKEGMSDVSSKEFSIEKTFRIYKAVNVHTHKQSSQTYMLNFCDPRMFPAETTRINEVLRGSYTNMLYKICQDPKGINIKPSEIDAWEETSPDSLQFVSPNWSANRLINYIVSEADIGGTSSSWKNGMFFFQTLNGGFRFSSIDTMLSMEFPLVFSYKPRNADTTTNEKDINDFDGLNTQIMHVHKPQQFDTLKGTGAGAYASSMRVYDAVRKLESDMVYDIEETFQRGEHLSGFPIIRTESELNPYEEVVRTADVILDDTNPPQSKDFTVDLAPNKAFEGVVLNAHTSNHEFDNAKDISEDSTFLGNNIIDNSPLERIGLLQILEQNRIVVTIPLRTDLTTGQIIKLAIPEPESQHDGAVVKDVVNDNRYLIVNLTIEADAVKYRGVCHLECVKESYAKDIRTAVQTKSSPKVI